MKCSVAVEVEVEYDYEAEFVDELTIRQGEVITNVKQMSGGWWEGTHPSGKHGLFPENFVKAGFIFGHPATALDQNFDNVRRRHRYS